MKQTDRQTLAVAAFEIDVELLGAHFTGRAGDAGQERRAAAGDKIAERQAA